LEIVGGLVPLMKYSIYRGTDSINVSLIDSITSTVYSNITDLIAGPTYFYRVSAVDSSGFEGVKSFAACAFLKSINITSPNSGTNWIVGTQRNVIWTSVNVIENVNIKLSTDGGNSFLLILKSDTPNDGSEIIDVPNNPSTTCRIKIESVTDNNTSVINDNNFSIVSYPATLMLNKTVNFGDINNTANYRLVSTPGNNSLSVFMSGEYEYDWQVYWDNGSEQNYLEQSADYTFAPGKAYWVLSKNPLIINQEVNSVSLDNEDYSYSIPLHSIWNLISTPFGRSTQWENVRALNGLNTNDILYYCDGSSYNNPIVMIPYEGYYFNNKSGLTQLKIPYEPTGSLGKILSENEYPVSIENFLLVKVKEKNQVGVSEVFIGINKASKNGFDENDYYAAPGDFQKIGISLIRNELPKRDKYFFIEQRPEIGEGQEFDVEIKAIPNLPLELLVEGLENFDEYNIYLLDERLKNLYNIKEKEKIELKFAHQYNPFKLFIGTDEYIDEIKQNIQSFSYELFQNYPNPFNPNTIIRFSLPAAERVSLRIFNILGEVVTTLLDNQIYGVGNYELEFNGKELSSGVYILGMETSKFKMQKKIVLLK